MLVYGRNVAKELLGKNRKIEKIILQVFSILST